MARQNRSAPLRGLEKESVIWRDRKRILGMPLSFTVYEMSDERLTLRVGFFRTETDELLLYRILDIKMVRTLGQKLFGVGTITIYTADQSHKTLLIKNIRNPDAVRRLISEKVEQERTEKGMRGREIFGSANYGVDLDGDGIPDMFE